MELVCAQLCSARNRLLECCRLLLLSRCYLFKTHHMMTCPHLLKIERRMSRDILTLRPTRVNPPRFTRKDQAPDQPIIDLTAQAEGPGPSVAGAPETPGPEAPTDSKAPSVPATAPETPPPTALPVCRRHRRHLPRKTPCCPCSPSPAIFCSFALPANGHFCSYPLLSGSPAFAGFPAPASASPSQSTAAAGTTATATAPVPSRGQKRPAPSKAAAKASSAVPDVGPGQARAAAPQVDGMDPVMCLVRAYLLLVSGMSHDAHLLRKLVDT